MFLLRIFIFEMKSSADNPTPYFGFFINLVQMSVNTACIPAKSDGFLFALQESQKQDNASSVSRTCATSLSQHNLLDYTFSGVCVVEFLSFKSKVNLRTFHIFHVKFNVYTISGLWIIDSQPFWTIVQ